MKKKIQTKTSIMYENKTKKNKKKNFAHFVWKEWDLYNL